MSKKFNNHYMDDLAEIITRRVLRKYAWLIELSKKHSMRLLLLQEIMDFLDEIPGLKKEGETLSVGLILKNEQVKLEDPLIEREAFHISNFSNFLHLKNLVDGSTLCYLVDEKGMVTIRQIPKELQKENSRLTLQNISLKFQAIAFHVGESRSEIYGSGELVRINRKGVWIKPCTMPLENLDKEGFPLSLLKLVFQLCLKMSELNKGSTFAIIKDDYPKCCSPMIRNYHFRKSKIDQIPQSQVINFASIDGALILNVKNELVDVGQKLEPLLSTSSNKESGRGTRHNSAAMYSKEVDSVVFVVSEDGPISIYFRGELYARCFGELFGNE
jgi:hypothetical protein